MEQKIAILFTDSGYNSLLSLAKLSKSKNIVRLFHMKNICTYILKFLE